MFYATIIIHLHSDQTENITTASITMECKNLEKHNICKITRLSVLVLPWFRGDPAIRLCNSIPDLLNHFSAFWATRLGVAEKHLSLHVIYVHVMQSNLQGAKQLEPWEQPAKQYIFVSDQHFNFVEEFPLPKRKRAFDDETRKRHRAAEKDLATKACQLEDQLRHLEVKLRATEQEKSALLQQQRIEKAEKDQLLVQVRNLRRELELQQKQLEKAMLQVNIMQPIMTEHILQGTCMLSAAYLFNLILVNQIDAANKATQSVLNEKRLLKADYKARENAMKEEIAELKQEGKSREHEIMELQAKMIFESRVHKEELQFIMETGDSYEWVGEEQQETPSSIEEEEKAEMIATEVRRGKVPVLNHNDEGNIKQMVCYHSSAYMYIYSSAEKML